MGKVADMPGTLPALIHLFNSRSSQVILVCHCLTSFRMPDEVVVALAI